MAGIHITDIEAAINWWRQRSPSRDGVTACPEVRALAEVYALMVYHREPLADEGTMPRAAHAAWLAWYHTTPDAPCIAICSTAQGDALCKGCGRTEDEVQHWPRFSPAEKRQVWLRITQEGTAWRFNRYAERAAAGAPAKARAQVGSTGRAAATGPTGSPATGQATSPVTSPATSQTPSQAAGPANRRAAERAPR